MIETVESTTTTTTTTPTMRDLLADPTHWCQGTAARDKAGLPVSPLSSHAAQRCIIGALHCAYPDRGKRMEVKFSIAFYLKRNELMIDPKAFPGALPSAVRIICQWQDHLTTTHTDVMDLLHALEL